ncbi:MAG: ABC transporter substrate-binding protein [Syntrophorhabdales bacterium]|jgi:peptide/nickel transport system substrate-binding protein
MKRIFCIVTVAIALAMTAVPSGICQQKTPIYGGVLRIIASQPPQMMSYVPLMSPGDQFNIFPAVERLVDTTVDRQKGGGVEPVLAEKVDEDVKNLKITFHIRKGITFHDGSEFDAEVARWNIQQVLDAKVLPYAKYLKDMKVPDKYTLVINLTQYSNQLMPSWGWWPIMISKAAWDKASGGDLEKGKEWARTHIIGTGPFMLKEYKRDVNLTWVKNPNYWRKGRPYLDGIEVKFIPEAVSASQMMQAKEADAWNTPPAKDQVELEKKGFKSQSSWPALGMSIWINTANPKSKWQDKRLREAVEYAIDKEGVAKALGFGTFRPLKSLPPPGEWGYDPNYNPRPYNPEKAKQLLKEAGYPNGLKAKLLVLITPDSRDAGTALKQYLDAAGFQIDLDVADPGRFFGSIYGKQIPPADADLAWWTTGRHSNYLQAYMRSFSTQPFTPLSYLGHPQGQAEADMEAEKLRSLKDQEAAAQKLTRIITDNALVIPIFDAPAVVMEAPWVHSTQYEQGFVRWQTEEVWMEKH